MSAPVGDASGPWRRRAPLLGLLGLALALHAFVAAAAPSPALWGDEHHYLAYAHLDALEGRTAPLPGTLRFDHRPEFGSRVDSLVLGVDTLSPPPTDEEAAPRVAELLAGPGAPRAFHRAESLRIALALLLGLLTHSLARALGSSARGALVGTAAVLFFPPLAFHAHAMWPELLHAVLVAGALLLLVRSGACQRRPAVLRALGAGALFGLALLTKGSLSVGLPVLALGLLFAPRSLAGDLAARLPRLLALGVGAFLVLTPQLIRNVRDGHGARLAANTWWNLELALAGPDDLDPARLAAARAAGLTPDEERLLPIQRASMAYFDAAPTPLEREALARERTLETLRTRGLGTVALQQLGKLARLLVAPQWNLDQALGFRRRWGETPRLAAWLAPLDRALWWLLLVGGIAGLLRRGKDRRAFPCALLAVTLLLSVGLVPFKARFLLPAVPLLALFLGLLLDPATPAPRDASPTDVS